MPHFLVLFTVGALMSWKKWSLSGIFVLRLSTVQNLSPEMLFSAYCQGIFPMAGEEEQILWFAPDPRAVLPLDAFHVSHSLQRTLRQGRFSVSLDRCFDDVIHACAAPQEGRETTWISPAIMSAYKQLHRRGFAHSVESWQDGNLAGGLYGVAINGLFAGESMFSRERDASKVALVNLVRHLVSKGFTLLDVQFMTEHLRQFGAVEISRAEYESQLSYALQRQAIW